MRRRNLSLVGSPSGQSQQQRRSDRDSSDSQASTLHRFLNGGLVWSHPRVLRILLRRRVENRIALWRLGRFMQSHLQHLCEMQSVTISFLGDLLAATKAVGDDQPIGGRLADSGQKVELART